MEASAKEKEQLRIKIIRNELRMKVNVCKNTNGGVGVLRVKSGTIENIFNEREKATHLDLASIRGVSVLDQFQHHVIVRRHRQSSSRYHLHRRSFTGGSVVVTRQLLSVLGLDQRLHSWFGCFVRGAERLFLLVCVVNAL